MLLLYPNSWILSYACVNIGNGIMVVFKGLSDPKYRPIEVSYRPSTGRKNYLGNRETYHDQAEGSAMINDRHWKAYNNANLPNYLYPSTNKQDFMFQFSLYGLVRERSIGTLTMFPTPLTYCYNHNFRPSTLEKPIDFRVHDGVNWIYSTIRFYTYERGNQFRIELNGYAGKFLVRNMRVSKYTYIDSLPSPPDFAEGDMTVTGLRLSRATVSSGNGLTIIYGTNTADFGEGQYPIGTRQFRIFEKLKPFFDELADALLDWVTFTKAFDSADQYWGDLPATTPTKPGWKMIMKWKDAVRDLIWQSFPADLRTDELLGEATQSAADAALKFEGNTGTLVKEVIQLKSTILDLWKLLQGDVNPKSLANLWLSGRYGLKLTYQDTLDLATSIIDEVSSDHSGLYSWSRGGAAQGETQAHCKLFFDPSTRNPLAKGVAWLMEWDLFPSLANVWDIIPYSFVVDWFVDVEGFLSTIDTNTFLSVMEVFSTCYSIKTTFRPTCNTPLGLIGDVYFTRYVRTCPDEPYQPIPSFSGNLPSFKNIIDGSSLIIQRI